MYPPSFAGWVYGIYWIYGIRATTELPQSTADSISRDVLSLTSVGVREDGAEGWILDKAPPPLSSLLPLSTPTAPPSETKLISQIDEDRPGREKPRCVSYISNSRGSSQIGRRLKGKIVGVHRKISGISLSPGPACLAPDTK